METPKPPLMIRLKMSGRKLSSMPLVKAVIASVGRESRVKDIRFLSTFTYILSLRLSIITFNTSVIVVLTPIPNGSDSTPITFVRHITEMKVKIPPTT